MRPKMYSILAAAIEQGIERGWNRAYKHSDTPSESAIKETIDQEIWYSIDCVFDFKDEL